jgi:hypothetical protein
LLDDVHNFGKNTSDCYTIDVYVRRKIYSKNQAPVFNFADDFGFINSLHSKQYNITNFPIGFVFLKKINICLIFDIIFFFLFFFSFFLLDFIKNDKYLNKYIYCFL